MGEVENRKFLIEKHLSKAKDMEETAILLLENNKFANSVSRSYYAVYHLISALLTSIGEFPRTHKGLVNVFYQYFVDTGKAEKQLHKRISKLLNARGDADYGLVTYHDLEDAQDALEVVRAVREMVTGIIKSNKT